ncbi:MAG: DinB family protein [Caulobacteraceae bacterium]|nr:DinB family protein [Caulobacteraceae bacterium]
MSNAFLISLFEHKAWCNRGLVEALRAAPADVDRRQWAVILFTFEHTARVDRIFKGRLIGEDAGIASIVAERWPDLDELAETMRETDAWYVDYAARVSPAEMETVVDFTYVADGEPGRMTKGEMLAHVITHGASHRGQIGELLGRLGLSGASDMMTTFRRPETN